MPDFSLRIFSATSLAIVPWEDPEIPTAPTRLNPIAAHPHRYIQVAPGPIDFRATVGGVEGELDVNLASRLFQVWWVEWSGTFPPALVQPAGQTSKATCTLPALGLGLFRIGFRRIGGGGAIYLPFNVEVPIS